MKPVTVLLRQVTALECRIALAPSPIGERHGQAKLTNEQARDSPWEGFSLAVSGMMMPPADFSTASMRLTTTLETGDSFF